MKPLIIFTGVPVYKLVIEALESKVLPEDKVTLTPTNFRDYSSMLGTRPMFSKYYLVYARVERKQEYMRNLDNCIKNKYIKLVYLVETRSDFESIVERLIAANVEYSVYNSWQAGEYELTLYTTREIERLTAGKKHISKTALTTFLSRMKYNMNRLDTAITEIAATDLTVTTISKLIKADNIISTNTFGAALFEKEAYRPILKTIRRHRYYPHQLIKNALDYVNMLDGLYAEYLSGTFSRSTALEWVKSKGSDIGVYSEYRADAILTVLSNLAYTKFLYIKKKLEALDREHDSYYCTLELYKLVKLLR